MKTKMIIPVLSLLALLVVLGVGYWLRPGQKAVEQTHVLVSVDCDLNRGPCAVNLPNGGRLVLEISPRPIPVLKPLNVEVDLEQYEATSMQLDFSGVGMDMGFNQVNLQTSAPGRFSGQATLPVCITGGMRWRASLVIQGQDGVLTLPFLFDTGS